MTTTDHNDVAVRLADWHVRLPGSRRRLKDAIVATGLVHPSELHDGADLSGIARAIINTGPDPLAEYGDHPGKRDTGKLDALGRAIVVDRYGRRLWHARDYERPDGYTADEWYRARQIHGPVTCG